MNISERDMLEHGWPACELCSKHPAIVWGALRGWDGLPLERPWRLCGGCAERLQSRGVVMATAEYRPSQPEPVVAEVMAEMER